MSQHKGDVAAQVTLLNPLLQDRYEELSIDERRALVILYIESAAFFITRAAEISSSIASDEGICTVCSEMRMRAHAATVYIHAFRKYLKEKKII